MLRIALTTAATKPIAEEITKETVKTIRVRECRVIRRDRGD
jgi:hypothetical protein